MIIRKERLTGNSIISLYNGVMGSKENQILFRILGAATNMNTPNNNFVLRYVLGV